MPWPAATPLDRPVRPQSVGSSFSPLGDRLNLVVAQCGSGSNLFPNRQRVGTLMRHEQLRSPRIGVDGTADPTLRAAGLASRAP
jgi:hypothetical protein